MPDFDPRQLTDAVLRSYAGAPDPRVRSVLASLIKHLHAFVRESELSLDEWLHAIDFLTRTGQLSGDKRQEFILLSDVLGVSMLVDAINHTSRGSATETTVLGPFYVGEHRVAPHGSDLAPGTSGPRMWIDASVTDVAGRPIAGAEVDVWHADNNGFYDSQKPGYRHDEPQMRARFLSATDGSFKFHTIVPNSYPVPTDGPAGELLRAAGRHAMRPAHIHFVIAAPGYESLVTHLFVAGDAYLETDAVYGVKPSLVVELTPQDGPTWPDGSPSPAHYQRLAYRFALRPGADIARPMPMGAPAPSPATKEIAP